MKISQIVPTEERVPPVKYGGTERVAYEVTEGLVRAGHDVTLFASGDSITSAKLVPTAEKMARAMFPPEKSEYMRAVKWRSNLEAVEGLIKGDFDIAHNHIGWPMLVNHLLYKFPIITTLHGLQDDYRRMTLGWYKELPFVSISNSQRKNAPHLNYVATVYNGVNLNELTFSNSPRDYVAFLGRTSPEKGLKEAIDFAKRSGVKLKIAAKIEPLDIEYFNSLKGEIDGQHIEYLGELNVVERDKFLGGAVALLAFVKWDEPFGLYIAEAMACGTPVIAFNRGSIPELIKDGQTGFIVDDVDGALSVWKGIHAISRERCRHHVKDNFTVEIMVKNYEKVYEKVLEDYRKKSPKGFLRKLGL